MNNGYTTVLKIVTSNKLVKKEVIVKKNIWGHQFREIKEQILDELFSLPKKELERIVSCKSWNHKVAYKCYANSDDDRISHLLGIISGDLVSRAFNYLPKARKMFLLKSEGLIAYFCFKESRLTNREMKRISKRLINSKDSRVRALSVPNCSVLVLKKRLAIEKNYRVSWKIKDKLSNYVFCNSVLNDFDIDNFSYPKLREISRTDLKEKDIIDFLDKNLSEVLERIDEKSGSMRWLGVGLLQTLILRLSKLKLPYYMDIIDCDTSIREIFSRRLDSKWG